MKVDKKYCSSSYLMYRKIVDGSYCFDERFPVSLYDNRFERRTVNDDIELEQALKYQVKKAVEKGKTAIALSGGIDSAILAKFMPKGSVAYTFRCIVPGKQVTDESGQAAKYAEACGLEQRIVDIFWEDFDKYLPGLMAHKGAPIHSIEVQIAKAAEQAKKDGFERMIFGESADCNYGGFSQLLSRDWTRQEFIDRYSFVDPEKVLKDRIKITGPVDEYEENGYINVHEFMRHLFYTESLGSYTNACDSVGVEFVAPFACTYMGKPLDLQRVRRGENKYWVRNIFNRLYPDMSAPEKIPMPRPVNEWFENWEGPKRSEFIEGCEAGMTGDQKWMIYCLERFLDMIE